MGGNKWNFSENRDLKDRCYCGCWRILDTALVIGGFHRVISGCLGHGLGHSTQSGSGDFGTQNVLSNLDIHQLKEGKEEKLNK